MPCHAMRCVSVPCHHGGPLCTHARGAVSVMELSCAEGALATPCVLGRPPFGRGLCRDAGARTRARVCVPSALGSLCAPLHFGACAPAFWCVCPCILVRVPLHFGACAPAFWCVCPCILVRVPLRLVMPRVRGCQLGNAPPATLCASVATHRTGTHLCAL